MKENQAVLKCLKCMTEKITININNYNGNTYSHTSLYININANCLRQTINLMWPVFRLQHSRYVQISTSNVRRNHDVKLFSTNFNVFRRPKFRRRKSIEAQKFRRNYDVQKALNFVKRNFNVFYLVSKNVEKMLKNPGCRLYLKK